MIKSLLRKYPVDWPGGVAIGRALGDEPVRMHGQQFRCDPYHPSFWRWVDSGNWEPETFRVFDRFIARGSVMYDIGAWIGPTSLYASRTARMVYCFEPDPTAYSYLLMNLRLNAASNIQPFNIALMPQDGSIQMASFGAAGGDSGTSVLKTTGPGSTTALGLSYGTWQRLTNAPLPDFVKIDVEGAEFSLVPALSDSLLASQPTVYLSTHAPYLAAEERTQNLQALLDALQRYPVVLDETLQPVDRKELLSGKTQNEFRSFVFTS
jgi:FkbM family methyltransferase